MDIPLPLLDDIEAGKCLPFVGAGFSLNARLPAGKVMPAWPELTAHLASIGRLAPDLVGQQWHPSLRKDSAVSNSSRPLGKRSTLGPRSQGTHTEPSLNYHLIRSTQRTLISCSKMHLPPLRDRFARWLVSYRCRFTEDLSTTSIVKMHGDLRHENTSSSPVRTTRGISTPIPSLRRTSLLS